MSSTDEIQPPALVPSGEEILQLEEASRAASDVTSAMLSQRMELDESKRSLQMLQKALVRNRFIIILSLDF